MIGFNQLKRQAENRSIYIAKIGLELVGIIEIRENNRISLLFVDKEYQGLGIAKKLFQAALIECKKRNEKLDRFYVHASPFSVPVYKKLGFVETDKMQENHGIKYLSMEMRIV